MTEYGGVGSETGVCVTVIGVDIDPAVSGSRRRRSVTFGIQAEPSGGPNLGVGVTKELQLVIILTKPIFYQRMSVDSVDRYPDPAASRP